MRWSQEVDAGFIKNIPMSCVDYELNACNPQAGLDIGLRP